MVVVFAFPESGKRTPWSLDEIIFPQTHLVSKVGNPLQLIADVVEPLAERAEAPTRVRRVKLYSSLLMKVQTSRSKVSKKG